jgi:hypothetical protein
MKYTVKRHAVVQPLDPSYRIIPLTKGQNALVDAEDYPSMSAFNWTALWSPGKASFYAVRRGEGNHSKSFIYMHRLLMECEERVDHWDGDGLNNRRKNLRPCTQSQNLANTKKQSNNKTGYKGVFFEKRRNHYIAKIVVESKPIHLGSFGMDKFAAAKAYDAAAIRHFGEFAHLNFPSNETGEAP